MGPACVKRLPRLSECFLSTSASPEGFVLPLNPLHAMKIQLSLL